jgi:drug/metabolite transporter (DMT)-like permease
MHFRHERTVMRDTKRIRLEMLTRSRREAVFSGTAIDGIVSDRRTSFRHVRSLNDDRARTWLPSIERFTVRLCIRYYSAMKRTAVFYALASAALFGLSTPAAKHLLASVAPFVLAGLLYCGAGIGTSLLRRLVPAMQNAASREVSLGRKGVPWLAGAIAAGGIAAPLLLMAGLARTEATTASLLLTLECAATALLAWFVFHENFDRRIALGMACLIAGATILAWSGTPTIAGVTRPVLIVGACIFWGLDNNLTRKVSLSDPLQIVEIKGLVAGPINLTLGIAAGAALPDPASALIGMAAGFVGYGLSLVLFVTALRHLGTARTSAYFATAPFIGAIVAIIALGEPVTGQLLAAGALMAIGVWLHLTEQHAHEHLHEPVAHAHPHVHDAHHQHAHNGSEPAGEPHTHVHAHGRLSHAHPHVPDMHHGHRH